MVIKRGEIWWATLPEPVRSEPGYKRPLVIVQSNDFNNSNINTVIAAVITTNLRLGAAPGNISLPVKKSKLPKKSVINVSQLITINKSFLVERVSALSNEVMEQIDNGIRPQLFSVYNRWRPNLRDEADNHLIELTVACGADYLVSWQP